MAYKFLERMENEEVQMYLSEKKYFEAWITAMRENELSVEQFGYKLEQEIFLKSSPLTEQEKESLIIEFFDMTYQGEWIN